MPELPEVETVVRGLYPNIVGRTFTSFTTTWPRQLIDLSTDEFTWHVTGQTVNNLRRRGKHILFDLDDGFLSIHLRMTGRLYIFNPKSGIEDEQQAWIRCLFTLDNGHELRFSDLRKFGKLHFATDEQSITGKLGPEPLEESFTEGYLSDILATRKGKIKTFLLNQHFIAGIGNIYADEALWYAKIDPRRGADTLNGEDIALLHKSIQRVLNEGIAHEGASFDWYRKPDGTQGEYQNHFKAYNQEDRPCSICSTPIKKIKLAQRGTHFCPNCQS